MQARRRLRTCPQEQDLLLVVINYLYIFIHEPMRQSQREEMQIDNVDTGGHRAAAFKQSIFELSMALFILSIHSIR